MDRKNYAQRSVGSIVNESFATARIFKYFGIDFCCGGHLTLDEACINANADIDKVIDAIEGRSEQTAEAIPFDSWPTDLLIDYVLKIHHRNIRAKGPELLELIRKVATHHADRHPELLQLAEFFERSLEDLESHLQKEEQVLFPYCYDLFEANMQGEAHQKMHCGTVANPIRVMLREHHDEGTRYKFIRSLMHNFVAPEDACASYRLMLTDLEEFMDALFEHIHIENNILFPRFVELETETVR